MNKYITKFVKTSKYISFLVDYCFLYNIHRVRSHESQFKKKHTVPKETDFLTNQSTVDIQIDVAKVIYQRRIGTYSFKSPIKSEYTVNNLVKCEFNENENRTKANVIVINGWRSDSIKGVSDLFLKPFCERGFNIYFYSLPYHLHRVPGGSYNGEYFISADIERTIWSVKQAVADVKNLMQWIKNNRTGKIILAGVSLGGYITNLVAAQEEADFLLSVFYANNLAYTLWNSFSGKYIKEDFIKNNFQYEKLKEAWKIIEPDRFKPIIARDNILLMSGKYDVLVPFEDSTSLWEAWGKPERKVYPFGHAGIVINEDEIIRDCMCFIDKRIR